MVLNMENNRLNLLVISKGAVDGPERIGSVLRCSLLPGCNTEFENVFFQQVIWPGKKSSKDEHELAKILKKRLESMNCLDCPCPSIEFPFAEQIEEDGRKKTSNSSFISFDFSFLSADKLNDVLSNEVLCEPISCDEINVLVDIIGLDKRPRKERFDTSHRNVDVPDPNLHAHSAVRVGYLDSDEMSKYYS